MAGLCVNPEWIPDSKEVESLSPSFLRSILYDVQDIIPLVQTGLPLVITLNNECHQVGSDWSGWDGALDQIGKLAQGRVIAIGCGNELDKYWAANEDDCPPSFAANLVKRARPILSRYGILVAATSVVSARWPEYLQRMADLCRESADWFDLHPYGQRPTGWMSPGWGNGNLLEALNTAKEIAGKSLVCTEMGITIESAGSEGAVADYMRYVYEDMKTASAIYSWFAWHDAIGAPDEQGARAFGLRDSNNQVRPAWTSFAALQERKVDEYNKETEASTMPPIIQAWAQLWQVVNPSLSYDENIHGWGIPTYWRSHVADMGSPVGQEIKDSDGSTLQTFALGVYRWDGTNVTRVS